MIWHDTLVSVHSRFQRLTGLFILLIGVSLLTVGCLRAHASLTISADDQVSGRIIVATTARDDNDPGPQLDLNVPFSEKITVSPYQDDGYVGSQAIFSDLTFAEVPQLVALNAAASGVDITLRRAGNFVILRGRVDLTDVDDPQADIRFTAAFPSTITSTDADRVNDGVATWTLKPGVVTAMNAQARVTDPSTTSFIRAAVWLGIATLMVAGIIGTLAWLNRDTTARLI